MTEDEREDPSRESWREGPEISVDVVTEVEEEIGIRKYLIRLEERSRKEETGRKKDGG